MKKQISLIVITICITLASIGIYNSMNHVTSKSHSISILSKYGTIEIQDDVLIYTYSSELGLYDTQILESLTILSSEYGVVIL